jgi:glutamate N-acetyltransferase/amino-acid N-acetyltransferase
MPETSSIVRDFTLTPTTGGVTAPQGFRSAALHCGIKAAPSALDLTVLATDGNASAAGIFTTNLAVAAPVVVSKRHLERSKGVARAIVVNSGCANACTGDDGLADAQAMARLAAAALQCDPASVLVASTGVIGVKLDMSKVEHGIGEAARALSPAGGTAAARAIMTTDPFPKESAVEITCAAGTFHVGGIAKGSGMIEPMMATMLGFITTDALVEPALLQQGLKAAADETFNAITVDGECSTNDCVFALASGRSGTRLDVGDLPLLVAALKAACEPLAVGIVRGGEGATKVITVRVSGARSNEDARRTARAIANSPLVKTAVHGGDPNWGRLVAAAGRSGAAFSLQNAAVRIGPVELFSSGTPHEDRAADAARYLTGSDIEVEVDLGTGGPGYARMWTCDLSAEYVRINADYRT